MRPPRVPQLTLNQLRQQIAVLRVALKDVQRVGKNLRWLSKRKQGVAKEDLLYGCGNMLGIANKALDEQAALAKGGTS